MGTCTNCGEPLIMTEDGVRHGNGVLFCAFATTPIKWNEWRTAKQAVGIPTAKQCTHEDMSCPPGECDDLYNREDMDR